MSIPTPEPSLVISYAYLWRHENLTGPELQETIELHSDEASDAWTLQTITKSDPPRRG